MGDIWEIIVYQNLFLIIRLVQVLLCLNRACILQEKNYISIELMAKEIEQNHCMYIFVNVSDWYQNHIHESWI